MSTTKAEAFNAVFRESLLAACLDIASSCVTRYPYDLCERFELAEKRYFFNILESVEEKDMI